MPLRILARRRDIHPVLYWLLEREAVACWLEIAKAVRLPPNNALLELTDIRVGDVLEPDLDLGC